MTSKNPTGWSNADIKNPTAFTQATKAPSGWQAGAGIVVGLLPILTNDGRMLMSNNGRNIMSGPSLPPASDLAAWS